MIERAAIVFAPIPLEVAPDNDEQKRSTMMTTMTTTMKDTSCLTSDVRTTQGPLP
jgi:uncharacterized ParB-like nuclease family protein